MTVLVTGGTGTVGSHLLKHLAAAGLEVHALTRVPGKTKLPDGWNRSRVTCSTWTRCEPR